MNTFPFSDYVLGQNLKCLYCLYILFYATYRNIYLRVVCMCVCVLFYIVKQSFLLFSFIRNFFRMYIYSFTLCVLSVRVCLLNKQIPLIFNRLHNFHYNFTILMRNIFDFIDTGRIVCIHARIYRSL